MALKSAPFYSLACDGCNYEYESGDLIAWAVEGEVLDLAGCDDWLIDSPDDKHYCPNCRPDWK